jgi:hypothetical protein
MRERGLRIEKHEVMLAPEAHARAAAQFVLVWLRAKVSGKLDRVVQRAHARYGT